ncbi:MAG: PDZ domain-containing protein [Actinomycetota bacterium]|nr:PDZ domain-containing protein [Actinomycetota bacterium]
MTSDLTPTHVADTAISVAAHLESELEEALAEHRLTRASFLVLDALDRATEGILGQRELVRSVRRTAGTISVRLGRMERARVIEREPDPDNRRSVTVTITERGRALVSAARPAYVARAQRLVVGLPDGAAAALDAWLAFFEPTERQTPRLGVAIGTTATAKRMRSAVGLPEEQGVLVLRVGRETPAAVAGVTRGDLITRAAGEPVLSTGDLERAVKGATATLTLSVLRGAEPHELEVSFGA